MKHKYPQIIFHEVPLDAEETETPSIPTPCPESAAQLVSAIQHIDLLVHRYNCTPFQAYVVLYSCNGCFGEADNFFRGIETHRMWTSREDTVIKNNSGDVENCLKLLPGRTLEEIKKRKLFLCL